jgi:hypothetical protein
MVLLKTAKTVTVAECKAVAMIHAVTQKLANSKAMQSVMILTTTAAHTANFHPPPKCAVQLPEYVIQKRDVLERTLLVLRIKLHLTVSFLPLTPIPIA